MREVLIPMILNLKIDWKIPKDDWIQSKKDKSILHYLINLKFLILRKIYMAKYLITGADGQLGQCFQ